MTKYKYHGYLYGNLENRKKRECEIYKSGECNVTAGVCPGVRKCTFRTKVLNYHFEIKLNNKLHEVHSCKNSSLKFAVLEAFPEKKIINKIKEDIENKGYYHIVVILQMKDVFSPKILVLERIYVGLDENRIICKFKNLSLKRKEKTKKLILSADLIDYSVSTKKSALETDILAYTEQNHALKTVVLKKSDRKNCIITINPNLVETKEIIKTFKEYGRYNCRVHFDNKNNAITTPVFYIREFYIGDNARNRYYCILANGLFSRKTINRNPDGSYDLDVIIDRIIPYHELIPKGNSILSKNDSTFGLVSLKAYWYPF